MAQWALAGYGLMVAVFSPICFSAYGIDKWQAGRRGRRISEATLHGLALCGGWPGALLGQSLFRHKTRKLSFRIGLWLTVLLHAVLLAALLYWFQS